MTVIYGFIYLSWNGLMERTHGTGSWNRFMERTHRMKSCTGSCTSSWNGLMYEFMEWAYARARVRAHVYTENLKAIHGFLAALTRGDKEEMSTLKYRPRALHFVIQYATCTLAKLKIKLVDPLSQEMSVSKDKGT
ncbi:hypothetical protein HZH68_011561 [Vespula germanica]|uniref:Uncharacterized protein n=1 Tax=Vespula germanica TaxID=30212 RepID=A0A834JNS4_VESGE|nr:hypothetical protein HZH68_011561 [Vespula germanica]